MAVWSRPESPTNDLAGGSWIRPQSQGRLASGKSIRNLFQGRGSAILCARRVTAAYNIDPANPVTVTAWPDEYENGDRAAPLEALAETLTSKGAGIAASPLLRRDMDLPVFVSLVTRKSPAPRSWRTSSGDASRPRWFARNLTFRPLHNPKIASLPASFASVRRLLAPWCSAAFLG